MSESLSDWHLRNVPEETKRAIKAYAAKHGLTIGEALGKLIKNLEAL